MLSEIIQRTFENVDAGLCGIKKAFVEREPQEVPLAVYLVMVASYWGKAEGAIR